MKIVCHINPHLLFLMEINCNECSVEKLRIKLNFDRGFSVSSSGSKGDLCLL